jgi:hypothetical protein
LQALPAYIRINHEVAAPVVALSVASEIAVPNPVLVFSGVLVLINIAVFDLDIPAEDT